MKTKTAQKARRVYALHDGVIKEGTAVGNEVTLPDSIQVSYIHVFMTTVTLPTDHIEPRTKNGKRRLLQYMIDRMEHVARFLKSQHEGMAKGISDLKAQKEAV